MRFFRRVDRYPELQGLTPKERQYVLSKANRLADIWAEKPRFMRWMMPLVALASLAYVVLLLSTCTGLLTHQALGWTPAAVLGVPFFYAIVRFVIALRLKRKALRYWLNETDWIKGGERRCSGCGYDLRGCTSDACPECGEEIPDATQAWIQRQVEAGARG